MKTRVFHVITKLELGGAQKITLLTLERLPRDQYELGLVAGTEGPLVDWANRIPNLKRVWIPSLIREVRPLQDALAFFSMWRLFRRERPHIVHTHSSKAGILGRWAAKLAGVPVVFHTAHGFGFHDFQRPLIRNLYIWLERVTAKITTKHFVVSYANAEKGENSGVFKRGDWILCRSGIIVSDFTQPQPRRQKLAEWRIPPDRVVAGMVACFKPQKAPLDFVDLAAQVLRETGRAHFVMIGDGELRPDIEARIQQHGISNGITLLGWQGNMPEVYRNLDIVVLTSLWEGLPRIFSEAMASELPIVATKVDGARDAILHGENGFLHEPHDIAGMARSVLTLVEDSNLRLKMGQNGRSRAMEFDVDTSVAKQDEVYRRHLEAL
jgi:glycosyltransferase involved in cell wall biosynthesis